MVTTNPDIERTTIQVQVTTRKRITDLKHGDMSNDTVLNKLVDYYLKHSGKTLVE